MSQVFMFPGQGSQYKGMGEDLFNKYPEIIDIANEVLGYSVTDLCLHDPNNDLNETQYTQPALFTVNALEYFNAIRQGNVPKFVIGHSLGEYNALLAAEVFDFRTGLTLVKERGRLMSQATEGKMAAIIGLEIDTIRKILRENYLEGIDIANINSSRQIVISGLDEQMDSAERCFINAGATYIPLKVSAAFHSRYMQDANIEFRNFIDNFEFQKPKIPIISNVTAIPYSQFEIKETLVTQITSSVRWTESINYILSNTQKDSIHFTELGPGNVLTKLNKTIISDFEENEYKDSIKVKDNQEKHLKVEEIVDEWNSNYEIGCEVKFNGDSQETYRTRTKAKILFDHRAVIYLEGFNGYFELKELIRA
ncbi:ACP S-malonyltransferase [Bacillus subtilis]|uniref:ACP S-malonyltransferase n=2 Tax=Bacillus subtilis TaxID=1423 RepID=UPI0013623433|nr:ACP S-malonyltransferase [Bacillus subtilis]MCO8149073.1 ACP S-malonyltransferase [Bacillus subtilis]MDQ4710330.1 ACP S-malonyltransferase [Bacillus subtilis]MEC2180488.1 ACP S-malonyltransferase [Bacillus subtilis]QHM17825.1 Polyketide biosynthesis malonyl CoA-acyl carrier protein transacylase PksC [Bacillus subtilis]CAF1842837.1 Polyketide biosynthesis malonyl CoA-acyl carrier protein transacylase PksC [Bacillus subtilis]